MKVLPAVVSGVLLLALGACLGREQNISSQARTTQQIESPTQRIVSACQKAVLIQLKAPATASFSASDEELLREPVFDEDDGRWIYIGNVDSENAFGAFLRNEYACQITDDLEDATITFDE